MGCVQPNTDIAQGEEGVAMRRKDAGGYVKKITAITVATTFAWQSFSNLLIPS